MRSQFLLLAGISFLVTACGTPYVETDYTPFHPGNSEKVTFRVKGSDGENKIKELQLHVFEKELFTSSTNMASARRRTGGTWGMVKSWTYDPPRDSVEEKFDMAGFPANSFIEYRAVAINDKGKSREFKVSFAAGDWPWPTLPVPIYGHGAPVHRNDVCFVPDKDYSKDFKAFKKDLEGLVYKGYFASNAYRERKDLWTFYYALKEADASGTAADFGDIDGPEDLDDTAIDAFGVIHKTDFRDGRIGNMFSTEPNGIGTAVHETGHAIFNLADEYCCDGGYRELDTRPNLIATTEATDSSAEVSSLQNCQDANSADSLAQSGCEEFTASADRGGKKWSRREAQADQCTMVASGWTAMNQFGPACRNRIYWLYGELDQ